MSDQPSSGTWIDGRHHLPVRVYYEDTDAGGVVYYASYLRFAERGRAEMMRHLGLWGDSIGRDHGATFMVRRCTVDYRQPAQLDDVLGVTTRFTAVGGASATMEQIIGRSDETLAVIEVVLVLVSDDGRPKRAPYALRQALAAAVCACPPS